MKKDLRVGFITTYSGRWPAELPQKRQEEYGAWLKERLGEALVAYPAPANTAPQVNEAIELFQTSRVDLVIMLYGAFTGDDFPVAMADQLNVPMILWAPKEPFYERDTRLFANALVAVTMNAASLHRLEKVCHPVYGDKEQPEIEARVMALVAAYDAIRKMRTTMFGLFGYRPTAFYNSAFDEGLIRRVFGIRMEETDLKVVFDRMEQIDQESVRQDIEALTSQYDTGLVPDGHLENHSKLYFALKELIQEQGYDFASLKCWPEMGQLHTTPCAVMGRLADEGLSISCEGDMDAGLAMILQRYLTGLPPFVTDMINVDEEANTLTFWHCGQPAPSLIDKRDGVIMANHPLAGQGTAFYGALKPGAVTIARFCNIRGVYKLFLVKGEAVPTRRNTKGAMVNVQIQTPVMEFLDRVFKEGIPHHYSLVWQDVATEMRMVAELLGLEVIEL